MMASPAVQAALPAGFDSEDHRRSAEWDRSAGPGNYLALIIAQATGSALALAAVWIATRSLGPSGYGGMAAIFAASQCIGQIFVQWTAGSLARYGCEEFVETGRIANTFWARLLVLIPNLLIVAVTSFFWLPLLGEWLHIPSSAYWLVLVHFLMTALWVHTQQGLLAAKLPRVQGALFATERGLVVSVLLALMLAGRASVISVALAYVAGSVGASAIGLWRLRALVFSRVSLPRSLFRKIFVFSLPLLFSSITAYLSTNYLDALFITRFLSVADLGIYTVAYLLAGTSMQFPLLIGTLLLPFFVTLQVGGSNERMSRYLDEVLPALSLGWSLACILITTAGVYVLPAIFGAGFRSTAELLWPLMTTSAMAAPVLMGYGATSNAKSATYIGAVAAAVSACVNVALNFILIPKFGLIGCAWATVGAYGASLVVWVLLINQRVPIRYVWITEIVAPMLMGAAYATWRADYLGAFVISSSAAVLVIARRRKHLVTRIRGFDLSGILRSALKPLLKQGV